MRSKTRRRSSGSSREQRQRRRGAWEERRKQREKESGEDSKTRRARQMVLRTTPASDVRQCTNMMEILLVVATVPLQSLYCCPYSLASLSRLSRLPLFPPSFLLTFQITSSLCVSVFCVLLAILCGSVIVYFGACAHNEATEKQQCEKFLQEPPLLNQTRYYKQNVLTRTKYAFSLEMLILGLKSTFSIDMFNPGPCFSAAREGLGMKKQFKIEHFIPY